MTAHRSARTGKFVTKAAAKRAPATTVKEKRTRCAEIEKAARKLLEADDAFDRSSGWPVSSMMEHRYDVADRQRALSALRRALARKE